MHIPLEEDGDVCMLPHVLIVYPFLLQSSVPMLDSTMIYLSISFLLDIVVFSILGYDKVATNISVQVVRMLSFQNVNSF